MENEYLIDPKTNEDLASNFVLHTKPDQTTSCKLYDEYTSHCDCGSIDHSTQFSYFEPNEKRETGELIIQQFVHADYTLWQRVKYAFMFVVLKRPMFFSDSVLSGKEFYGLVNFMSEVAGKEKEAVSKLNQEK